MNSVTVEEAIALLNNEHVVAVPTETVYGLAARYDSRKAIDALYLLKGRPKEKALTVNLHSAEEIKKFLLKSPAGLDELMRRYWPGPLTLVVPIQEKKILADLRGGRAMCGFRVPDHPLVRDVIRRVGPLVLPSANFSGESPATDARQVYTAFGANIPILDGGPCKIGVASTVLMTKEGAWEILREGAISKESLTHILDVVACNNII